MKQIYKHSMLHIPIQYLTELDIKDYKELFTIKNSEEFESGMELFQFQTIDSIGEVLSLPREAKLLEHHQTIQRVDLNKYHTHDFSKEFLTMQSNFDLRDYQINPVEKIIENLNAKKSGILECPAGGGKTNMAIWMTLNMNLKTLFLCDQYELLEQAYERFVNFGGVKPNVLTSARNEDNNSGITLSLLQSLSANKELFNKIKNDYGLIIIDECHIAAAPSYNYIVSQLQGLRLGLTATDRRKDGNQKIYRMHIGKSFCKVDVDMLKCEVEWFKSSVKTTLKDPTLTTPGFANSVSLMANYFNKITKAVLTNKERNEFIVNRLIELNSENRTILLITKTIDHIELIKKALEDKNIPVAALHSKQKKKEAALALTQIKSKEVNILLTVNKANKGMDIDILDTLFLCFGGNNDVQWEQRIGRIQRFKEGKKQPLIIDISDTHITKFSNFAKNRSRFYIKEGFKQTIINL